jgi:hypothetical protein
MAEVSGTRVAAHRTTSDLYQAISDTRSGPVGSPTEATSLVHHRD